MSKPMHEAPQTESFPSHGTPQSTSLPAVNYEGLRELLSAITPDSGLPPAVPLSAIIAGKVPPFAGWRRSPSREDVALRQWWVALEVSLKRQGLELHVNHAGAWYITRGRS
ncbi:MAG: hypothetical protein H7Z74_09525 [Anaerolineae bacterium]|nr:hypothetical protein [Gemmatimonadaceae bacterium]